MDCRISCNFTPGLSMRWGEVERKGITGESMRKGDIATGLKAHSRSDIDLGVIWRRNVWE